MNSTIETGRLAEKEVQGQRVQVQSRLIHLGVKEFRGLPTHPSIQPNIPITTLRPSEERVTSLPQTRIKERNPRVRHPNRRYAEIGGVRFALPKSIDQMNAQQKMLLESVAQRLTDGYKKIANGRQMVRKEHQRQARVKKFAGLTTAEKYYVLGSPVSALISTANDLWTRQVDKWTSKIKNPRVRRATSVVFSRVVPIGTTVVAAGLFLSACGSVAVAYDPDRPTSTPQPVDTQIAPSGQHTLISADSPLLTTLNTQNIANHCLVDTSTYQNLRSAEIQEYQRMFAAAADIVLTLPGKYSEFKCVVVGKELTAYFIGNDNNDLLLVKPDGTLVSAIKQADGKVVEVKPTAQLTPSPNPPGNEVIYPGNGIDLRWNETQFGTEFAEYLLSNDPYKADAQRIVSMLSQLGTAEGFQQNRLEFVGSIGNVSWVIALKYDGKLYIPKRDGLLIAPITPYNFLNEFAANPELFSLEDVEPPSGYASSDLVLVEDISTYHVVATSDRKYYLDLATDKWRSVKDGSEFKANTPTSIPPTPETIGPEQALIGAIRYVGSDSQGIRYITSEQIKNCVISKSGSQVPFLHPETIPGASGKSQIIPGDIPEQSWIKIRYGGIAACDQSFIKPTYQAWHSSTLNDPNISTAYMMGLIVDTAKGPVTLFFPLQVDAGDTWLLADVFSYHPSGDYNDRHLVIPKEVELEKQFDRVVQFINTLEKMNAARGTEVAIKLASITGDPNTPNWNVQGILDEIQNLIDTGKTPSQDALSRISIRSFTFNEEMLKQLGILPE